MKVFLSQILVNPVLMRDLLVIKKYGGIKAPT
jgi:hypothetical protein